MIAALLLLTASAAAAAAPAPHVKPYWLKTYSLTPYRETWRGELTVKNLEAATPKIVAAVEGTGGRLTQPLENFIRSSTEQQLSLVVPLKKAKVLLAALRKLGKAPEPAVRPQGEPIPLDEVKRKLKALTQERAESWDVLARVPAAAEAIDELIERLTTVETAARLTESEVLWNLTVKEAR